MRGPVPLTVDLFADIACPWCWVGLRRLRRALAARPRLAPGLIWHPFRLSARAPAGGLDALRARRGGFGGAERARETWTALAAEAAREGLTLAEFRPARLVNTLDAHRLIRFAQRQGRGLAMIERLYEAAFVEGRDLAERETLVAVAADLDLPREATRRYLRSEEDAADIVAQDEAARRGGIRGVPSVILGQRYLVMGAEEAESYLPVLDILLAEADAP